MKDWTVFDMKHSYEVDYDGVKIRQIKKEDLENLRVWRNRADIGKYLRPINHISEEEQLNWFEQYLNDEQNITFAIVETKTLNRMVGSVSLYDFDGSISDCGKTVIGDPEASGMNLGFKGEVLALHVGFQKLGVESYITEVNKDNIKSQKMTKKLGFTKVGERPLPYGGEEDLFEMTKKDFYELHNELIDVEIVE